MHFKKSPAVLLSALLLSGAVAQAATMTWSAPATIAGDPDVATSGALTYAYDISNTGTSVNTVPFAAGNSSTTLGSGTNVAMSGFAAFSTGAFGSGSGSPWSGLSTGYQTILRGGAYANINSPATITLRNLALGHLYLVQVWAHDNRSGGTASRTETVTSGSNTVTLAYNNTGASGGVGQYTIGTFVTDGTSQAFTLSGTLPLGSNSSQLNAIQVRDLGRVTFWKGGVYASGTNVWDVGTTGAWLFTGTATTFSQGDNVTFDDTGSASPAILLTGTLSPGSVTVSSSNNYTFGGTGYLSGNMTLVKSGTGTLTLSPASVPVATNTTGSSALVTVSSTTGLLSGMLVSGNGIQAGTTIASISGTTLTLSQAVTTTGTGVSVTYYRDNTYSGTTTLNGGTTVLGGFQQSAIGSGPVVLQGGSLTLNGATGSNAPDYGTFANDIVVPTGQSGTLKLMQRGTFASTVNGGSNSTLNVQVAYVRGTITGDWSGFAGQINVTGSTGSEFRVGSSNGFGTATINLGSGVIMDQSFNPPNDGLDAGTTQIIGMLVGSGTLGGQPVVGRVVNWQVGGNNTSGTFNGVIQNASANGSGAARITKEGTGTWTLANPCTYSGSTVVNSGTLIINGLPNSSGVTVASGATLGGSGTIAGPVMIQMNSNFQQGNTLVFAGGINLSQSDGSSMTLNFGDAGSGFGVLNSRVLTGGTVSTSGFVNVQVNVQNGTLVTGTYVLASGGTTGNGTAQASLIGAPSGFLATLDATSQPGKLLLVLSVVAFPGAEGYGAAASGGRGGSVYHVTNLNDSGPGSFRDAVSQTNRTVVFDVGGIINLASDIEVQDNITIAGQSAPGQGIAISGATVYLNHGFGATTSYGHSNIIIRHMRFRQGFVPTPDGYSLALKPAHTVMIDHCSIEIGNWQTLSISLNTTTGEQPTDITVQNCIVGASISTQLGVLDWSPVNLTFHHNLFADNGGRDPKAEGNLQIINDVVYNYRLGVYGDGAEHCDLIGNYHIGGPDTNGRTTNAGVRATAGYYYISGNYWDKTPDGTLNGSPLTTTSTTDFTPTFVGAPQNTPLVPVTVDNALLAYYKDVSCAGCSLNRDPLDAALVSQVASLGTLGPGGVYPSGTYVTGLYMQHVNAADPITGNPIPDWSITGGPAPLDTDNDGMPDDWELATGSNPTVADNNQPGTGGYTKLENYLNWMAEPHARMLKSGTLQIDLSQYTAAFNAQSPVFVLTSASNGTVTLLADGHTAQYVPTVGYTGLDGFNFTVTAQDGTSMTKSFGILISTPPGNIVWKGDGSANIWNTTVKNWLTSGTAVAFNYGDNVTFDDTGSNSPSLNIAIPVNPSSVTINANKSYTLSGTGCLYGGMTLTKSGTGNLTISPTILSLSSCVLTSGSYTVTVPSTANLAAGMAVWVVSTNGTVPSNCTVASIVDSTHITLSAPPSSSGTSSIQFTTPSSYSGGTVINSGTVFLTSVGANHHGLGSGPVTINGGALSLYDYGGGNPGAGTFDNFLVANGNGTIYFPQRGFIAGNLTGAGTLTVFCNYVRGQVTGDWSGFTGQLNAVTNSSSEADFYFSNTNGFPNAALYLGRNVRHEIYGYVSNPTSSPIGELSGTAGAMLSGMSGSGAGVFTWQIGGLNTNATYAGNILEATAGAITGITKVGTGTLTASGTWTHTGPTIVNQGTLAFQGLLSNTNTVEISSGATLNLSGTLAATGDVTVDAGGLLTGSGSINSDLLNQGTTNVASGTLTVNGNITNQGTFRLTGSGRLQTSGTFTNYGVMDIMTSSSGLPAHFINQGVVIDSRAIKVQQFTISGTVAQITIQSYTGHSYQLQRSTTLSPASWTNVSSAQAGNNAVLTFTDSSAPVGKKFYRISISP